MTIEEKTTEYLKRVLDVPVYMGEEPATKPSEYIVIQILDNGRINMIDAVTFNIISYSTSLQKASELNNKVKDAMYNIVSLVNVSSSKCGGGGQAIETSTKRHAYECVFNLFYMED